MITRRSLIVTAAALVATVLVWWRIGTTPLAAQSVSNAAPSSISNLLEIVHQPDEERRKLDPARWWKTPVSFYGRMVDQDGAPVPQADVKYEVNDTSARGTTEYHASSDATGSFSLTGVKGANLDVIITKNGYYQSRAERHLFSYAGAEHIYEPDPKNPIVFHLHKGGTKVALIHREILLQTKVGAPVFLDMLNDTTNSTGGQIEVDLVENERGGRNGMGARSRMRLSVPNGKIQTNADEFPFVAPEDGYRPSVDIGTDFGRSAPGWGTSLGRAVYLKAQGLYARAQFELCPGGSLVICDYYINPSGSRDLEPDSNLLFSDLESYNAHMAAHPQTAR